MISKKCLLLSLGIQNPFNMFRILFVFVVVIFLSCKDNVETRDIKFVENTSKRSSPVDSLIIEMDGLMQQYAAAISRSEQGEAVDAHIMAIQAKMADFGLKMEIMLPDLSSEDVDRFNEFYDECLCRMAMVNVANDASDVAF